MNINKKYNTLIGEISLEEACLIHKVDIEDFTEWTEEEIQKYFTWFIEQRKNKNLICI